MRAEAPPEIDGVLDEPFWQAIPPITGFVQREPADGRAATEDTEVRVGFDQHNLYVAMVMHDREPHRIRRTVLQREGQIGFDDRIIIALDTYHDRRNAYIFEMNAFGTQGDALINDESLQFSDWNWEGVYHSEGRITEDGWVIEAAIPFTTIRFTESANPQMGIAFYRSIRRKNEEVTWPHIPIRYGSGIFQVSQYATLVGLEDVRRGNNVEVKPFAITGAQRFEDASTDVIHDAGVDIKYGITSGLTLDLTLNTDFAQVEADNVQVNLTRFGLFFPEKREFFLERAGLFSFGAPQETEVFFSRRIGIDNDILGGGRLTGEIGPLSVGALSLQTRDRGDTPGANNAVVRLRTAPLPRMSVGTIFTNLQNGVGHNRVAGADAAFRFWGNSYFDSWVAKVWDSELSGPGRMAGAAEMMLRNSTVLFEAAYNEIGEQYAPALGFVSRPDQRRIGGQFGVTPWFPNSPFVRQLHFIMQGNHIWGRDGEKQSHFLRVLHRFRTQSGENLTLDATQRFERLEDPFAIRPDATIPLGDYTFNTVRAAFSTNGSRSVSANASVSVGEFYDGTRRQYGAGMRWNTGPHLQVDVDVDRNDIALPIANGDFSTTVVGVNMVAAVNRKIFANSLFQYDDDSETIQANIRINWIHTPGSDLFLVFDTGYQTGDPLEPMRTRWVRRTGVLKVTYLKAL